MLKLKIHFTQPNNYQSNKCSKAYNRMPHLPPAAINLSTANRQDDGDGEK